MLLLIKVYTLFRFPYYLSNVLFELLFLIAKIGGKHKYPPVDK